MVAFEHVLPSAFAKGARPRARAATAAIAKVLAMVLRLIIISFAFVDWFFREEIISTAIPLRRCRRQHAPKSGHGSCIIF
jgi:hypothetical protein